jgi:hypothetical protein
MPLSTLLLGGLLALQAHALPGRDNPAILRRACPDYTSYASTPQYVHLPPIYAINWLGLTNASEVVLIVVAP